MDYPKVLVLTRAAWNNSNCCGNTYSNIFDGWPSDKVANMFLRAEDINNNICCEYYRVTEQELMRSLLGKGGEVGKELYGVFFDTKNIAQCGSEADAGLQQDINSSRKIYNFFSRHRWTLALWCRELLWWLGSWKNKRLDAFLEKAKPDVVFMILSELPYMHHMLAYVQKKTGARICLFAQDDTYTLHKRSWSPLFWLNLFWVRHSSRKLVRLADTLFVISDKQKKEYEEIFKRKCVLLRKGGDFSGQCTPKPTIGKPIKLVYTGNIQAGRWKTLAKLAASIHEVNGTEERFSLSIYSLTPKSPEMLREFGRYPSVHLMPPASSEEIKQALQDADILVFVEPFETKVKLQWRLSFSTKIVDYLASSRPILAIGPSDLSSMNKLSDNDAAFCVTDECEPTSVIRRIAESPEILQQYAQKAWDCGSRNNRIEDVQATLLRELRKAHDSH